jgi:hypothetical protein
MDKNVDIDITIDTRNDAVIISQKEILAEIRSQLKRINWTKNDAKRYLVITYGTSSILVLSDNQLLEFVEYIAGLPVNAPMPYKQPSQLALKGLAPLKTNPLSLLKTANGNHSRF